MFYVGAYSYMADISSPENRTARFAIMHGIQDLAYYLGNFLAGPIKTHLGLRYNFAFAMMAALMAALYVLFRVKENRRTYGGYEKTARDESTLTDNGGKMCCVDNTHTHIYRKDMTISTNLYHKTS